ncbi:MAG: DNA primase catalytic subunit PriS [Candidatus Altiarchaeota archaeon]|nr:DNA primase catalytic subunit PriS [Candidatus Altiarchaeota archaeon]
MNVETKIFLGRRFKEFYLRNPVPAPRRVEQREFGFGTLDDKIKFRHKSFASEREMQQYLQRDTPFFVSYSAAYYEFPESRTMAGKAWQGADLIFDLDADAPFLDERVMSDLRRQALNLLNFLTEDFGFESENISVNFSGSKGYHLHCRDERILKLTGDERREIVDYVTATGLDRKHYFHEEGAPAGIVFSATGKRDPKEQSAIYVGPAKDSTGWPGRIYRGVWDELSRSGMDEGKKRRLLDMLERGMWEGVEGFRDKSFDKIIRSYAVRLTEDTDKMVTLDTSRLIRLPMSLHGGTGLKAAVVRDLSTFRPQADAVAFGDAETSLTVTKDVQSFPMKDNSYGPLSAGENIALPEHAAIYLMLKDCAELVKQPS